MTKTYTFIVVALTAALIAAGCRPGTKSEDPLISGLALMETGDHEEARDALILATSLYTSNVTAHCNLGLVYWLLEDDTAAVASLTRAAELAGGDPRPLEILAHVLIASGNERGARQVLSQVETPTATTLTLMALAAYKAGSSDLARSYLGRALDLREDYAPALYNMALLWRDAYDTPREALSYYKRFRTVAPNDRRAAETPQTFIGMGRIEPPAEAPRVETPTPAPAPAPKPEPKPEPEPKPTPKPEPEPEPKPKPTPPAVDSVNTLIKKAHTELSNGNVDTALLILKGAVTNYPNSADAAWALAQIYDKNLGLSGRANELYNAFAKQFPSDPRVAKPEPKKAPTPPTPAPPPSETAEAPGETHFRAGLAHYAKHDWERAIAAYKEALRADSTSAGSAYNLGLAYKANGDMDKAAKAFTLALGLEKDMPKALYMLGLTEMQRGRNPAALAQLNRLLRVEPNFAKAHYLLGVIYREEGRPDMAVIHFERLIHLAPTDPSAENARRWLAQQQEASQE